MAVEDREDVDWAWVTPRRLRVLAMLADDRTEQEIADELGVAYSTVRSHVEDLKGSRAGRASGRSVGIGGRKGRSMSPMWRVWRG